MNIDPRRVSRIEIHGEASMTLLGIDATFDLQDDGRTLKIYYKDNPPRRDEYHNEFRKWMENFNGQAASGG